MSEPAIVVDLKGLARKLEHRPKAFVIYELLQNAWDEPGVTYVRVSAEMLPGRPVCEILVEDDSPEGFAFLESFFTMYRDSKKAANPELRGRFEIGEKLVIALSTFIELKTTKGTITIQDGKRQHSRRKRETGSLITAHIRMTRDQYATMMQDIHKLAPPEDVGTYINGERLKSRSSVASVEMPLQTVRADDEGNLRTTTRNTRIKLYEVREGETAHIYELGIPVVELDESLTYHADVQQKVPVNWERNNVPPSYRKALGVAILNALSDKLSAEEVSSGLLQEALGDPRTESRAVKDVVITQHGNKAVIFDPSDSEGTKLAHSQGYTVVPGGAYSKAVWGRIKETEAILPAGQVTPSPKPYDPNGHPEKVIPEESWTKEMQELSRFCVALGSNLFDNHTVTVRYVLEPHVTWTANYEKGGWLCLNLGRLGKEWPNREFDDEDLLSLLIHEYAHEYSSDHLSSAYHRACTRLGARVTRLALTTPRLFQRATYE